MFHACSQRQVEKHLSVVNLTVPRLDCFFVVVRKCQIVGVHFQYWVGQ